MNISGPLAEMKADYEALKDELRQALLSSKKEIDQRIQEAKLSFRTEAKAQGEHVERVLQQVLSQEKEKERREVIVKSAVEQLQPILDAQTSAHEALVLVMNENKVALAKALDDEISTVKGETQGLLKSQEERVMKKVTESTSAHDAMLEVGEDPFLPIVVTVAFLLPLVLSHLASSAFSHTSFLSLPPGLFHAT
eukprot:TRINITY_DN6311_c0_g1_i4.p1 TRINITY_DN6311_c0_g1~~TRINITY_DN6311_c0_g1_i4.p1  ORF type:complete len:195 (-),score=42.24 TRINITY_DN6311_c0_g1_i4:405-989(-)